MAKLSKRSKLFIAVYGVCVPALCALFFAVYSLVVLVSVTFTKIDFPQEYDVRISVKGSRKDYHLSYDVKDSDDFIDGNWYVNFSRIADVCSFPVGGDMSVLRYKIENPDGSCDYLKLDFDDNAIYVNSVRLCRKIVVRGEDIYLPADFVNEYINGINIEIDDDEKRINIEVESEYSLKLKDVSQNGKIDVNELDPSLIESNPVG